MERVIINITEEMESALLDFKLNYTGDENSKYYDFMEGVNDVLEEGSKIVLEYNLSYFGRNIVERLEDKDCFDICSYEIEAMTEAESYFCETDQEEIWELILKMDLMKDFEWFIMTEWGKW